MYKKQSHGALLPVVVGVRLSALVAGILRHVGLVIMVLLCIRWCLPRCLRYLSLIVIGIDWLINLALWVMRWQGCRAYLLIWRVAKVGHGCLRLVAHL
jgi:hypothetical protein